MEDNKIEKLEVGKKYPVKDFTYIKVMAFSEGYFMAMYKGCMPFCMKEKQLIQRIYNQNK